jgi:hypothetical protein
MGGASSIDSEKPDDSGIKRKIERKDLRIKNARIVEVIIVKADYELQNGLMDLNRDVLMKLIKVIDDEPKIRIVHFIYFLSTLILI